MGIDIEDANPVEVSEGQVFINELYTKYDNPMTFQWGPAVVAVEDAVLDDPQDSIELEDVKTGKSRSMTYINLFSKEAYDPVNHSSSYPGVFQCDSCGCNVVTKNDINNKFNNDLPPGVGTHVATHLITQIAKELAEQLGGVVKVILLVKDAKDLDYEEVTKYMENGELVCENSSEPIIHCTVCSHNHDIPKPVRELLEF